MSQRRRTFKLASIVLGGLILSGVLLGFLKGQWDAQQARERLSQTLNDSLMADPSYRQPLLGVPDVQDLQPNDPAFPALPSLGGEAGVDVQETEGGYVLRIPLARAEDAQSVSLQVTPHRIQVSGQTGSQQNATTITSQFMQSFSTSQEVLPEQVSRELQQNGSQTLLIITIPKKLTQEQPASGFHSAEPRSPELPENAFAPYPSQSDEEGRGEPASPSSRPHVTPEKPSSTPDSGAGKLDSTDRWNQVF